MTYLGMATTQLSCIGAGSGNNDPWKFLFLCFVCENHENLDRAKISRYMGMATTQLSCIGAGSGNNNHGGHYHFSETFVVGHSVYLIMLNLTKKNLRSGVSLYWA